MAHLIPNIIQKFLNADGEPLAGGKLYTYQAGTSTPLETFVDQTEATPNTNPIILDANGEARIWIGADAYKFVLTDEDDVVLWTEDNISHISTGSVTADKIGTGAVTEIKLATSAVTADKIGPNAVTTAKIQAGAVTTAKIADSGVTTAKIADSNVTEAKLANASATMGKLGVDVVNAFTHAKNRIINGDFEIWQRGNSFTQTTIGALNRYFAADHWQFYADGGTALAAATFTVEKSTDVPAFADAGRVIRNSLKWSCTSVATPPRINNDRAYLIHTIEGYFFRPIAQRAQVLSFWVKAFKPGKYSVCISNGIANQRFVAEYTINTASTWERKTVQIAATPNSGTWDYVDGRGLLVAFALTAGPDLIATTANAWMTDADIAVTGQVDSFDSISNTFFITGVQLERGSVATSFEERSYLEELSLCQRYLEIYRLMLFSAANTTAAVRGLVGRGTFRTEKRIADFNPAMSNPFYFQTSNLDREVVTNREIIGSATTTISGAGSRAEGDFKIDADFSVVNL